MANIEKIEKAIETINKECEDSFLLLNCSNEFAEALATAITYMERHKTLLEGIEKARGEVENLLIQSKDLFDGGSRTIGYSKALDIINTHLGDKGQNKWVKKYI